MRIPKQSFVISSMLLLAGCETPNPYEQLNIKSSVSSLKKNKAMQPNVAQAFLLLKEGKYSEASTFINATLQSQPKNVIFHILNALTYEKLAEKGDGNGLELAIVGYQNALNLDPFNSFAITQLGKIRYREKEYDQAQEHFANALLIKPNDPDLIHEFAAASYYAYDIKTAIAAIKKAEKLKPEDPLIQRSATMMYAAIGDFKAAEKHFKLFQAKVGQDLEVEHVANRFKDWQSLYKSGRVTMAAAQIPPSNTDTPPPSPSSAPPPTTSTTTTTSSGTDTSTPVPPPPPTTTTTTTTSGADAGLVPPPPLTPPPSGGETAPPPPPSGYPPPPSATAPGLSVDQPPPGESDTATAQEFKRGNIGANIVDVPLTPGVPPPTGAPGQPVPQGPQEPAYSFKAKAEPGEQQIIIDCYILKIDEIAGTSKGNNIMKNLAVTLNPGTYTTFGASLWGRAVPSKLDSNPIQNTQGFGDNVTYQLDNGNNTGVFDATGKDLGVLTTTAPDFSLNSLGGLTGHVFAAGITWAGLTYSLNIASASDIRTEIMARPTLMTFLRKESAFFSGLELVNVSGGQYGSNLSRYQIGVGLSILPESLVGDLLTLKIGIESSNQQSTNLNLLATITVEKTRIETTARIHLGETIMLGGIYQRAEVQSNEGFPGLRDVPIIQYFFSEERTASDRNSVIMLLTPRSPDAVKSAVNRAMTRESVRPHFSELVSRNPDWFHPQANAVNIFRYINLDPVIYYEFRTGDILPPSWGYEPALADKLTELASFLYF